MVARPATANQIVSAPAAATHWNAMIHRPFRNVDLLLAIMADSFLPPVTLDARADNDVRTFRLWLWCRLESNSLAVTTAVVWRRFA